MNNSEPIVLGSGNFSTTYLKEDQGQLFVLKKIKPKHNDTPKVIRLFENEALFSFDHPGLPKNVEYFIDNHNHYILKPYLEGESLEKWKEKKFKGLDLKQVILKWLDLMILLETNDIVHCDLKPSNILVDNNGSLSLIDFGLAQRIGDSKINYTLFSLGFASPELILNRRNIVDSRTDIFSFGMVMYYLIDGKLPFTDANPSHFTNLQITLPLPKSSKIRKELMAIILKCCSKHQFELPPNRYPDEALDSRLIEGMNNRYQSFKELKTDLKKLEKISFKSKPFRF
jgi:serine/threonine-protein kinase